MWAGIIDQTIIGQFKVDYGLKLNTAIFWDFMNKTFFTWYKFQSRSFKVKCVFMRNNAPSHVSKLTCDFFFNTKDLQEKRKWNGRHQVLIWMRSKIYGQSRGLYRGSKQYNSKTDLWGEIKTTMSENEQNQWIIDYWLFLRRRLTTFKCKGFICICYLLYYK